MIVQVRSAGASLLRNKYHQKNDSEMWATATYESTLICISHQVQIKVQRIWISFSYEELVVLGTISFQNKYYKSDMPMPWEKKTDSASCNKSPEKKKSKHKKHVILWQLKEMAGHSRYVCAWGTSESVKHAILSTCKHNFTRKWLSTQDTPNNIMH